MISLTNKGYGILTTKNIRFHQRSVKVKKRSNLKNVLRDPIFGMYTNMISLTNKGYDIMTTKFTRGHQRSLEVKFEKYIHGCNFLHAYSYDILDQHMIWCFDHKSHLRSPEVTEGQKEVKFEKYTQGPHLWHFDPKGH